METMEFYYRDHGKKKGVAIAHYTDRKRPVLCVVVGNHYTSVGYFKDSTAEKLFTDMLKNMFSIEGLSE